MSAISQSDMPWSFRSLNGAATVYGRLTLIGAITLFLAVAGWATLTYFKYTFADGLVVTYTTSSSSLGQFIWSGSDGSTGSGDLSAANASLNSYDAFDNAGGALPAAVVWTVESGGGNKQR